MMLKHSMMSVTVSHKIGLVLQQLSEKSDDINCVSSLNRVHLFFYLYLAAKSAVIGVTPTVHVYSDEYLISIEEGNVLRVGEHNPVMVRCEAYIALSSAVVKLDWHLQTEDESLISVTSLPGHSVSGCALEE